MGESKLYTMTRKDYERSIKEHEVARRLIQDAHESLHGQLALESKKLLRETFAKITETQTQYRIWNDALQ